MLWTPARALCCAAVLLGKFIAAALIEMLLPGVPAGQTYAPL